MLAGEHSSRTFLVFDENAPVGFVEVSMRDWAEGCETRGVGYLEGIFVDESHRRRGVASALLAYSEEWARAQGATEFASDVEMDNVISQQWHGLRGFSEVAKAVLYRKDL